MKTLLIGPIILLLLGAPSRAQSLQTLGRDYWSLSESMALTGHKTRSVFERYNIVSDDDLASAAAKLDAMSHSPAAVSR